MAEAPKDVGQPKLKKQGPRFHKNSPDLSQVKGIAKKEPRTLDGVPTVGITKKEPRSFDGVTAVGMAKKELRPLDGAPTVVRKDRRPPRIRKNTSDSSQVKGIAKKEPGTLNCVPTVGMELKELRPLDDPTVVRKDRRPPRLRKNKSDSSQVKGVDSVSNKDSIPPFTTHSDGYPESLPRGKNWSRKEYRNEVASSGGNKVYTSQMTATRPETEISQSYRHPSGLLGGSSYPGSYISGFMDSNMYHGSYQPTGYMISQDMRHMSYGLPDALYPGSYEPVRYMPQGNLSHKGRNAPSLMGDIPHSLGPHEAVAKGPNRSTPTIQFGGVTQRHMRSSPTVQHMPNQFGGVAQDLMRPSLPVQPIPSHYGPAQTGSPHSDTYLANVLGYAASLGTLQFERSAVPGKKSPKPKEFRSEKGSLKSNFDSSPMEKVPSDKKDTNDNVPKKGKKANKKSKRAQKKETAPSKAAPVSVVEAPQEAKSSTPPVRGSQSAWQLILNLDEAIKACEERRGSQTASYASHFQQRTSWPKLGETKHSTSPSQDIVADGQKTDEHSLGKDLGEIGGNASRVDAESSPTEQRDVDKATIDNILSLKLKESHISDKVTGVVEAVLGVQSRDNTVVELMDAKIATKDDKTVRKQKDLKEHFVTTSNRSDKITWPPINVKEDPVLPVNKTDEMVQRHEETKEYAAAAASRHDKAVLKQWQLSSDKTGNECDKMVQNQSEMKENLMLTGNKLDKKVRKQGDVKASRCEGAVPKQGEREDHLVATGSKQEEALQQESLRERRKARQAQKREEKRRKREEEFRKRLLAPKDQKVTLIGQDVIDKFLGRTSVRTQVATPTNDASEFPALGFKKRTVLAPRQATTAEQIPEPVPLTTTSKKPKRKDPITIDIMQAIKTSEIKQQQQEATPVEKRTEPQHYGGNPLDSDNPERKRGKFRENRTKKPTKLKSLILAERAMKKNAIRKAILQKLTIQRTPRARAGAGNVMATTKEGDKENGEGSANKVGRGDKTVVTSAEKGDILTLTPGTTLENDTDPSTTSDGKDAARSSKVKNETLTTTAEEEEEEEDACGSAESSDDGLEPTTDDVETRLVIPEKEWQQLSNIHSRRFREYCDHSVTPELNVAVEALLRDIVKFHDAQFHRNPLKANARRRHVTGLKEVKKLLGLRKLKLVVIVPDLEKVHTTGGLDDKVDELKQLAAVNNVPCVFALSRKQLGKVLYKEVPVSCVGIINYEGAENKLRQMLEALAAARNHYWRLTKRMEDLQLSVTGTDLPAEEGNAKQTEQEEEDQQEEEDEEEEEVVDVNKQVVSSLLAKLCERDSHAPFLQAIEAANATN